MVRFARKRKLFAFGAVVLSGEGSIENMKGDVSERGVQNSTVFTPMARGEFRQPIVSKVRRGVCHDGTPRFSFDPHEDPAAH